MHATPSSIWVGQFVESEHPLWALTDQWSKTVERHQEFPKSIWYQTQAGD